MSDLLDGSIDWDFIARQHHAGELKRVTGGVLAATKPPRPPAPSPPPERTEPLPDPVVPTNSVLEQTRLIARAGMAARDLGHAIANNLRALHTQEER